MDIPLSSAGSLSVSILAFFFFLLQIWLFAKRTDLTWNVWGSLLSLIVSVYSFTGFVQYNSGPGEVNRYCELVQYTCMIWLVYAVYGFTFAFLNIPSRFFRWAAAATCIAVTAVLWTTDAFVGHAFVSRSFLWLNRPFIEPRQGPLGKVLFASIALATLWVVSIWARKARRTEALFFFAGIALWTLLGLHDMLATMGVKTVQFLMQYGYLGFALSIVFMTANTYVEAYTEAQKNAALARSQMDLLNLTMRSMTDGFFSVDGSGRLVLVNDASARMFRLDGFTAENLAGRSISSLLAHIDPLSKDTFMSMAEAVLERGKTGASPEDVRVSWDQGGVSVFSVTHGPILDEKGAIVGAIFVVRDVTEVREMERRILRSSKMEAIGTLAGGIAHDFNNILTGIQGFTSLMLMETDPGHPHHERLVRIEKMVSTASSLTRELLGFARTGMYDVRPLDITKIIEKAACVFTPESGRIDMVLDLHEGTWTVRADPVQMEQVFLNLFVNASHAMPSGGELRVKTENVVVDADGHEPGMMHAGRYVRISVSDTGMGMDGQTLERIFEPFFTTKKMGRGTGLGLAMVYGIVRGHRGYIDVESTPGKGTTFTIHLPATNEMPADLAVRKENVQGGRGTILIVDDEDMVLDVSRGLLETMGYKVYTASSATSAFDIFSRLKGEIDLVILDMIMPDMSGKEVFRELRKVDPRVRVLLCSGYSMEDDVREMIAKAGCGFLHKPFNASQLSEKVREILTGHDPERRA